MKNPIIILLFLFALASSANAQVLVTDGDTIEVDGTTYVCNGSLGLPNGLGGTYIPRSTNEQVNALAACESEHGAGNCCNDGCGSCNQLGYHLCGAPNCNGSVYWNYANNAQNMNCGWVDPDEILISLDGVTWQQ